MEKKASTRVYYLDSLRVLAVLAVFLFHAAKAFTAGDWHIMNEEINLAATVLFIVFLAPWGMPFFFLLAGAGTWFGLQRRSARQFSDERFKRLLVPYLIGCALLTPLQGHFEWRFAIRTEGYRGSFLQFFADRWRGWNPTFFDWLGYHLWFLGFLFAFSSLALPLLLWLKGASGRALVSRLAAVCERRGGILVFILPLLLIQLGLRPLSPLDHSWADLFYDLAFFLSGYLFFSDERFARAIRRDRWLALATGSAALLGLLVTVALGEAEKLFSTPDTPAYYLFWAFAVIDAWCWSLTMLYVGMRFLDFSNRWIRYGQQAIVPFYLFHQPVIVAIAFFVVQWNVGVLVKLPVVALSSFVVSIGLYELIVRRTRLLWPVFGMKAVAKLSRP